MSHPNQPVVDLSVTTQRMGWRCLNVDCPTRLFLGEVGVSTTLSTQPNFGPFKLFILFFMSISTSFFGHPQLKMLKKL